MGAVESLRASHPTWGTGAEPGWFQQFRSEGLLAFPGFPGRKVEAFRYSPTVTLGKTEPTLGGRVALGALDTLAGASGRVVFLNGQFAAEHSKLPAGVSITRVADLDPQVDGWAGSIVSHAASPFAALNAAFVQDGLVISVERHLAGPLHIVHVGTGDDTASAVRHLVRVSGSATVLSQHVGTGAHFANVVIEADVADNAALRWLTTFESEGKTIEFLRVRAGRSARVTTHSWLMAGALSRQDVQIALAGEGAEATVGGLLLAGGKVHVDLHTRIEHLAPHCQSREAVKGIASGRAKAVFNGMVHVAEGAHHTDSQMSSRNLLLTEDAELYTKPELEIFNDDVKCSHGATVGQLDPNQVAYLRSRGIPAELAAQMLTRAFVEDTVVAVGDDVIEAFVREKVSAKLAGMEGI